MRSYNGKNLASQINSKIKETINSTNSRTESMDSIRESRMGWRGTGIWQYAKYHSTEGVYTIGIGGPPVVGK
jgi:hypothetical protein